MRYLAILIPFAATAATSYLPETSTRTMQANPLAPGEVAVVREQGGTATLYVGGDTGGVSRVAEPTGIRGWRVEDIPIDELAYVTSGVVVSNGAFWVFGSDATGMIAVTTKGGETIREFDYEEAKGDGGISPEQAYILTSVSGPELRFTIMPRANGWVCVSNIVCRRVAFGDVPVENDLTKTRYSFWDSEGGWELGNLRYWVKHLYDGNRGEDWASYRAVKNVDLDKKALMFDRNARYFMREDGQTNLVLSAGGHDAMTVSFRGANVSARGFVITDFKIISNVAYITYEADIDGFSPAGIGVLAKEKLDDIWQALTSGEFTATDSLVTVPLDSSGSRFFRLTYGDAVSQVLEVRFAARVVLDDALIIRGSGADTNKYYRITVEGGAISATEVSL